MILSSEIESNLPIASWFSPPFQLNWIQFHYDDLSRRSLGFHDNSISQYATPIKPQKGPTIKGEDKLPLAHRRGRVDPARSSELFSCEETKKMVSSDLVFSIFFFIQIGIGLLGNSILLVLYVSIFIHSPHWMKPTDLILTHLTVANTVTLLTQAAPGMVMAFGWKNIMDVLGCQIVMYMRRVARGLSICTTCLLSVFQAITISPSNSWWAQIKPVAPKFILPSFPFFWVLCLLLDINTLIAVKSTKNTTTISIGDNRKSCPSLFSARSSNAMVFIGMLTLRDVVFVSLMSWSSGYMVMVLYQHRKRVRHIHSGGLSPKSSPESRATQTILLLVSCFVSFYCINSSLVFLTYMMKDTLKLYDPGIFLSSGFTFLCPLVLINSDPRLRRFLCVLEKVGNLSLA
ncbi:vomeronasal type-1 receptor 4-like [Tachyglossus aculeatus]|uniref:vomeronasal type-1 receptor 4-like n=1 Tax=Tachyglossus aculeatus TaxID=9261 RepID=UPI0018F554F1|nr:vomeronasal type-1 receptor 4-like [Tachyglossus aculeatus]